MTRPPPQPPQPTAPPAGPAAPRRRRFAQELRQALASCRGARRRVSHSLQLRLVLVFLALALAMSAVFLISAQRAFSLGWREAARPLLADYVDHLAADISDGLRTPDLARARALTDRLPLTVRIDGPRLHWQSHPQTGETAGGVVRPLALSRSRDEAAQEAWQALFTRRTVDGHVMRFGLDAQAFERRPRMILHALGVLLLLTLLAWWTVRRLLRPLEAIGAGARRFGRGEFEQPIALPARRHPDELGELAQTIDTMGRDIHRMLEAKRALLLAISHELRSPLTRARLHAELLPEEGPPAASRAALLRDLQEMGGLISDLLESERLSGRHAVLQREPTDLATLCGEVLQALCVRHPQAAAIRPSFSGLEAPLAVDPARTRLLLRNLLDNALRHGRREVERPEPATELRLHAQDGCLTIEVRDHGPGVAPEQLNRLAEPFYRPDAARTRSAGGVGLGLWLCRLVTQAHGGELRLEAAAPGLRVIATLGLSAADRA
ncbi:sensor histidine kinase [Pseudaquabacterium rugosum]|uniref:histidine kinase n=1 Tax=Pseudaquabacterium rugosum TaxID=2984194 RepID=A0ABU9B9N7_9BURK